jgi:hypothetical protein
MSGSNMHVRTQSSDQVDVASSSPVVNNFVEQTPMLMQVWTKLITLLHLINCFFDQAHNKLKLNSSSCQGLPTNAIVMFILSKFTPFCTPPISVGHPFSEH